MASRLTTLKTRLASIQRNVQPFQPGQYRMRGRGLQERRKRIWLQNPNCADCGRLTVYPNGFELDHRIPVSQGGPDTDDNCQLLCSGKDGCHAKKTRSDERNSTR